MLARLGLGLFFGIIVLGAVNAHADNRVAVADQVGPPGMTPAEEPPRVDKPAVVDQGPAPLATMAANDATSDRAFGRSTALALDRGQFDFSMRTVVEYGSMLSIAAGLGHSVEISADAGYARRYGDDYGVGLKVGLIRERTWALAFDASVHSLSIESLRSTYMTGDLKVTTCAFDGNMLFTAGLGAVSVSDSESGPVIFVELSMLFGTGYVRPLLEGISFDGQENLAFAGLRIGGRHVGVDLGVGLLGGKPGDNSEGDVGMLVGVGVRP